MFEQPATQVFIKLTTDKFGKSALLIGEFNKAWPMLVEETVQDCVLRASMRVSIHALFDACGV